MSYEQIALQLWGNAHVYRQNGEDTLNSEKHIKRIEREIEAACKAEALSAVERMLLKDRDKAIASARSATKDRKELKQLNKELKEKIEDLELKVKELRSEARAAEANLRKIQRKKTPKAPAKKKTERTSPLKSKVQSEPKKHRDPPPKHKDVLE